MSLLDIEALLLRLVHFHALEVVGVVDIVLSNAVEVHDARLGVAVVEDEVELKSTRILVGSEAEEDAEGIQHTVLVGVLQTTLRTEEVGIATIHRRVDGEGVEVTID